MRGSCSDPCPFPFPHCTSRKSLIRRGLSQSTPTTPTTRKSLAFLVRRWTETTKNVAAPNRSTKYLAAKRRCSQCFGDRQDIEKRGLQLGTPWTCTGNRVSPTGVGTGKGTRPTLDESLCGGQRGGWRRTSMHNPSLTGRKECGVGAGTAQSLFANTKAMRMPSADSPAS